jgi:hypothetical protein
MTPPSCLADFFFIAGLEGHEPAILNHPHAPGATTATIPEDTVQAAESAPETLGLPEDKTVTSPPTQETCPRPLSFIITTKSSIVPESRTRDNVRNSIQFDDRLSKFSAERDEFLLTLAPPSVPAPPLSSTSVQGLTVPEEDERSDRVPELVLHSQVHLRDESRPESPLGAKLSLRNKLGSLSRRASTRVAGTLRPGNTNCTPQLSSLTT